MAEPLLQVESLVTAFQTDAGLLTAVDGVSFSVDRGRTLGLVGESGCGKSVTAFSIAHLLPQPHGRVLGGSIRFDGLELTGATAREWGGLRGREMGFIYQEPMTALNPVHRIGKQLAEAVLLHHRVSPKEAMDRVVEMLRRVRIPSPEVRIGEYPHQLSGGMRQRAMIAMALINRPKLLIADEPTTALDVTVQAQILRLIADLQHELGMAVILITHDLGVIAETCDDVAVMYAGRLVERASAADLFARPRHAYTRGLLASIPTLATPAKSILPVIPGQVGSIENFATGCRFCQRLGRGSGPDRPTLVEVSPGHWAENCPLCLNA